MKKLWPYLIMLVFVLFGCRMPGAELAPTPLPTLDPQISFDTGITSMQQNDFSGAALHFQEAIASNPDYGPAYSGLALAALWQGEEGITVLDNAQRGLDLGPETAFAQSVMAFAQMVNGQQMEAVGSANRAVQLDSQDPFAQMMLVLTLTQNYEYDRAWQKLTGIYANNPDSPQILIALGTYFTATDDFDLAAAAFERAVEMDPDFVPWRVMLAKLYLSTAKYSSADDVLNELLGNHPDYLPALVLQVELDLQRSEFSAAADGIEHIQQLAPDQYHADFLNGELARAQLDFDSALQDFQSAHQRSGGGLQTLMAAADIYLQQEDCSAAAETMAVAAISFPQNTQPLEGQGRVHLCEGDNDAAVEDFQEAVRIDPHDEAAWFGLSQGYQAQGQIDSAKDALVSAMISDPSPSHAHFAIGELLLDHGDIGEAISEARMGLQMDEYSVDGYNLLAAALLVVNDPQEALDALAEASALNPDHPVTLRLKGIAYYLYGHPESALEMLDRAIAVDPEYKTPWLVKALALRDQGKSQEAVDSLNSYMTMLDDQEEDAQQSSAAQRLLQELEDGYQIARQSGIEKIQSDLRAELGYSPDFTIEDLPDGGETLVVQLSISSEKYASQAYVDDLEAIARIAGRYMPRMTPAIENGLQIEASSGTKGLFLARLSYDAMKSYADTLGTADSLYDHLAFDLSEDEVADASIASIIRDVADLRGLRVSEMPGYHMISPQDYSQSYMEGIDEEYIAYLEDEIAPAVQLGIISGDNLDLTSMLMDYESSSVAGYYSAYYESVIVVAKEEFTSYDLTTLVHECEHAVIDQAFDLDHLSSGATDEDRDQAITSLVEGDARFLTKQYLLSIFPGIGYFSPASQPTIDDFPELDDLPAYFSDISNFPYVYGKNFVSSLYENGGWDRINRAFRNPPISSEQIMHPDKYESGEAPDTIYLDDPSDVLGSGWKLADQDLMGEYGTYLFFSKFLGSTAADSTAAGWGGDRYLLLRNSSLHEILIWRTMWDTQEDADEFYQRMLTVMYYRSDYHAVVSDFSEEHGIRIWQNENGYFVMVPDYDQINILVGDDLEQLQKIIDSSY